MAQTSQKPPAPKYNVWEVVTPYRPLVAMLVACAIAGNALNLVLPRVVASAIDAYVAGRFDARTVTLEFLALAVGAFIFLALQGVAQTYASERAARDLRERVAARVSRYGHAAVQETTPGKLLSVLTSDVDSVKTLVSQAMPTLVSSAFLIVGTAAMLLSLDWRLGALVLLMVPAVSVVFFTVFRQVRSLFKERRVVFDRLNKIINESVLGAALIRVLAAERRAARDFDVVNDQALGLGMKVLKLFAAMIPVIVLISNLATLAVVGLGGRFVIGGSLSLGKLAAFNGYVFILVFPIMMIGFMSNLIAEASASYGRIREVLDRPEEPPAGATDVSLRGDVALRGVTVSYDGRFALKDVTLEAKAGTRTAIIGPTAAGKSQLLYALTGLVRPQQGTVLYDGRAVAEYDAEALHRQIGFVFQDSIVFNLSLRENIAFGGAVSEEALQKAIEAAELAEFVAGLPDGLETVVSERGASLSGGQKQRLMLARALALNPRVLLLDDFTARVDARTEAKILDNVARSYPGITLISVTQKVSSIESYDQVVVLMEGELIAAGTHAELLRTCPEYAQIVQSQRSTSQYELRAE